MSCSTWQLVEQSTSSSVMPRVANSPPVRITFVLKAEKTWVWRLSPDCQSIKQPLWPLPPTHPSICLSHSIFSSFCFCFHFLFPSGPPLLSFASYHLLFSLTSPVSHLAYSNTPENRDVLIEVYQEQHDTRVRRWCVQIYPQCGCVLARFW